MKKLNENQKTIAENSIAIIPGPPKGNVKRNPYAFMKSDTDGDEVEAAEEE
jgi:hypothetical protein